MNFKEKKINNSTKLSLRIKQIVKFYRLFEYIYV